MFALTVNNTSGSPICTLDNAGNMVVNGLLNSNGFTVLNSNYNPLFCGGFVSGSNGAQANNVGRVTSSCVRLSTGKYQITYLTAYPNNNYMPSAICYVPGAASPCFACIGPTTGTTKLEVNTFVSNVLTDCNFYFKVF